MLSLVSQDASRSPMPTIRSQGAVKHEEEVKAMQLVGKLYFSNFDSSGKLTE